MLLLDKNILWGITLIPKLIKIIKGEKINILYTTSPPESMHIIGSIIKLVTKLPISVDFRDSSVSNPNKSFKKSTQIRTFFECFLERSVIINSEIVISATSPITEDFKNRHSYYNKKFYAIVNGVDFEKLPKIAYKKSNKMRIVYTGSFQWKQSSKLFLEGLRDALEYAS